jgi:hypothetical protein
VPGPPLDPPPSPSRVPLPLSLPSRPAFPCARPPPSPPLPASAPPRWLPPPPPGPPFAPPALLHAARAIQSAQPCLPVLERNDGVLMHQQSARSPQELRLARGGRLPPPAVPPPDETTRGRLPPPAVPPPDPTGPDLESAGKPPSRPGAEAPITLPDRRRRGEAAPLATNPRAHARSPFSWSSIAGKDG